MAHDIEHNYVPFPSTFHTHRVPRHTEEADLSREEHHARMHCQNQKRPLRRWHICGNELITDIEIPLCTYVVRVLQKLQSSVPETICGLFWPNIPKPEVSAPRQIEARCALRWTTAQHQRHSVARALQPESPIRKRTQTRTHAFANN